MKLFYVILFLSSRLIYSQTGVIMGIVYDKNSGETLPGASVFVPKTQLSSISDLDGKFSIKGVAAGEYSVVVSFVSYDTEIIKVKMADGDSVNLVIKLHSGSKNLSQIDITTEMSKNNNAAITLLQKNNLSVSDGISAENIKRTPDLNTSQIVKRINGVSLQDDKFIIVRGLNDRYNLNYLNGAPVPSTEPDRKAFSFDIIPSNMVDNIIITKTARPDLPGDFVGGIIEISTKSIPGKNFLSLSTMGGYSSNTTGKTQLSYKGGKKDWIGFDDGTRAIPSQLPDLGNYPVNLLDQGTLSKSIPSGNWGINAKKFSPNSNFQLSGGHKFSIKGREFFGILGAMSYNKTNTYFERSTKTYDTYNFAQSLPLVLAENRIDKTYSTQILASALLNLTCKISNNHIVSLKNLYCINSDDRVIHGIGGHEAFVANPIINRYDIFWFTGSKIKTSQLIGDHNFEKLKMKVNWVGAYNELQRDVPDLRRMSYSRYTEISNPAYPNPKDTVWQANIMASGYNPDKAGGRYWSTLKETSKSARLDILRSFRINRTLNFEIKIGGMLQKRERTFETRQIAYNKYQVLGNFYFNDSLTYLDQSQIFSQQNMGLLANGTGGFKLIDFTSTIDTYTASADLQATYGMIDFKCGEWLKFVTGARIETYRQKLTYKDFRFVYNQTLHSIDTTVTDILPSINLIISTIKNQNIRLSYSKTLNRPEFRELAPFRFYDVYTERHIAGNPNLQRAKIDNYDIRYEIFPGIGQVVSVSGFYKNFINPIEQSLTLGDDEVSFNNTSRALCYGFEAEYKLMLSSLFKRDTSKISKIFSRLLFSANYSYIKSSAEVVSDNGNSITHRPLQGQSPYIVNGGLTYLDKKRGYSLSFFLNRVGQRIYMVGNILEPTIWENGRTVIDMQITKSLFKNKLELKFSVKDLLAQNQNFYMDKKENGRFDKNDDLLIWVYSAYKPTLYFQIVFTPY